MAKHSGWRLISVVALLLTSAPALARDERGPHAVGLQHNVMVSMRDGVRLATDVYLPAENDRPLAERRATIMMRTPYGKGAADKGHADGFYFASWGYAVVFQDTRGRYDSEGTWHMLVDDGPDGCDTTAWIARQAWSNGKVGTIGTSYVGGTQHALALAGCPQLVTAIPVDAMSNLGYASMRNGGAFELRFWNWIMLNAGRGSRASHDPAAAESLADMAKNRLTYLANLPLRPGTTPLKLSPEYESWLVGAMRHGGNDDYWRQNSILDRPEQYKDIPLYLVGGWYDSWGGNTTANYVTLSHTLKNPVYLIMGPWIHHAQHSCQHGDVTFGPDAAIAEPLTWRRTWFDHWLNGQNNAIGRDDPFKTRVRIFVMGTGSGRRDAKGKIEHGGYWRNEETWPLARAKSTPFYLGDGGRLSTNKPTANRGCTQYRFDPNHPVPTIGGQISSNDGIMLAGAFDQRGRGETWNTQELIPLSARNDVLVFQTPPLADDTEVTGELKVKLWVSSSAVDTDFTAKLIDVYPASPDLPGGCDLLIGDGIQRTRFRDSRNEEKLMKPGEIYPLEVRLYPTSNVFRRGHRIRVDISSSNFPRFDLNPNTGEPLNDNRRVETAVNTIHHDAQHPSQIVLPIVPRRAEQ